MTFSIAHTNLNVIDLDKSLAFYQEALGLHEVRRKENPGQFTLVFLSDADERYQLELTHLAQRTTPYDLADNEIHIAFATDDLDAAREKHRQMGCIAMENEALGIYFIEDPDGYWLEIIPRR